MTDIFEEITKETEFKQPPALHYDAEEEVVNEKPHVNYEADPNNANFDREIKTPVSVQKTERKHLSSEFTSDLIVDAFETIQHPLFFALNSRKQRKKRFKDKIEYETALSLSYSEEKDLKEDEKKLANKIKLHKAKMKSVYDELDFTEKEQKKLKKPLSVMVHNNNWDIPPGLAFTLAMMQIASDRVIDLIMD
jgi:hypothetical protein